MYTFIIDIVTFYGYALPHHSHELLASERASQVQGRCSAQCHLLRRRKKRAVESWECFGDIMGISWRYHWMINNNGG